MRGTVIACVVLSVATARAQPKPLESLTLDAADLPSFTVGPQHAHLRWLTVDGCGRVADLTPLRGLPAGIEIQLGKSDCLAVDKLDGIESAGVVFSFAVHRDISALASAKGLHRLHLGNGPVPLAALGSLKLPALEELDVNALKESPAAITKFLNSPLVAQVKRLSINLDRVPTLPSLPNLTGLDVSLMLANPTSIDLSFVRQTRGLRRLRIGGAVQANLAPLLALDQLETLDVAGLCRIDPRPLAKLPKLRWLAISELVDERHKPVRNGLEVHRSNPYALCSPPKP